METMSWDAGFGVPRENESTSPVVHFLALSAKTLSLLYSGRLGELVQLLRSGRETAEKNGSPVATTNSFDAGIYDA